MTSSTLPGGVGSPSATDVPRFRLRRIDLASTDPADLAERRALCRRGAVPDASVRDAVRPVLDDVRSRGAAAIRDANARFGGGSRDGRLVIGRAELSGGRDRIDPADLRALEQAIDHVARFAAVQRPQTTRTTIAGGIEIERRWLALDRIGCYVPGGSAPYPSSLVMTVVPARAAGIDEIVVATPADSDGRIHPALLAAADLLDVDAILVAGGAQAIGGLAFGWEVSSADGTLAAEDRDFAPVDRIVGPGNAWVTAAKLEVAGRVGIDLPAGPSEGMVLGDAGTDPRLAAADLVTQAEHGPDSPALLVTTSRELADDVEREIAELLPRLERRAILERALLAHGRVVLAPDLDAAAAFVDAYAPEHLSVHTSDADAVAARIRHAGSIFVGPWAPESAGDYATGANHVLPTGGLARACDPLGVEAFGRWTQIQRVDEAGLRTVRDTVARLATVEGLTAHRHAVDVRFEPGRDREPPDGAPR